MLRTVARSFARNWHREFRRKGLEIFNGFSIDYLAAEKKYQIKKMKRELEGYKEPEKPKPLVVKKLEDIPHLEYARKTIKDAMAKLEKEYGPFTFQITKSPDGNPANAKVKTNEKAYRMLWLEILKDDQNIEKVVYPLQLALNLGLNLMAEGTAKSGSPTNLPAEGAQLVDGKPVPPEIAQEVKLMADELEKAASTADMHRIDIGLVIHRSPIFIHITDKEMEWLSYRYKFMNEYFMDLRELHKDIVELVPSREEYTREILNRDPFDIDQQPTHRMKNPDGTESLYYAASKNYTKVDPYVTDKHSLHYAPNHRVYLLVKNKQTKEWEFPIQILQERQSLRAAKDALFERMTKNKWKIAYLSNSPFHSTLTELTDSEKEQLRFSYFHGVRTFYFWALHNAGIPEVDREVYEDFAWVPKREINQFLSKDTFEEFKHFLSDL